MPSFNLVALKFVNRPIFTPAHFMQVNLIFATLVISEIRSFSIRRSITRFENLVEFHLRALRVLRGCSNGVLGPTLRANESQAEFHERFADYRGWPFIEALKRLATIGCRYATERPDLAAFPGAMKEVRETGLPSTPRTTIATWTRGLYGLPKWGVIRAIAR